MGLRTRAKREEGLQEALFLEDAYAGDWAPSEDENLSGRCGAIFRIDVHAGSPAPSEDENAFSRGRGSFGIDAHVAYGGTNRG